MSTRPDEPYSLSRRRGIVARIVRTASGGVFAIDAILRCLYGVRSCCYAEGTVLRVARTKFHAAVSLEDGTSIPPGDPVLDLHIWNERLSALGTPGPNLAWACRVKNRVQASLRELAWRLECDGTLSRYLAVRANVVVLSASAARKFSRIAGRFGLVPTKAEQPAGWGHGMLVLLLAWACNPGRAFRGCYQPVHREFWISAIELRSRYPHIPLAISSSVGLLICEDSESSRQNVDSERLGKQRSRPLTVHAPVGRHHLLQPDKSPSGGSGLYGVSSWP